MNCSSQKCKTNRYRAAKIVTGKEKLNLELGFEPIMQHGHVLGINMFHKIPLHETSHMKLHAKA